jgi:ribonuclease T2
MRRMMVTFLALGLSFCPALAQNRGQGEPGVFDYYELSLSWSPSYCATAHGSASDMQCGRRPFSFVVHGLWPQYEKGYPEKCQVPSPRLDHRIVDDMLDLMPGQPLVYHEWDTHGTCSGLPARDYFDTIRKARAKVVIPPEYDNPQAPLTVSPQDVIAGFVKANPGLNAAGVLVVCDRTRLREVHVCLTRDLAFRDCSDRGEACRSPSVVMPPARGQ